MTNSSPRGVTIFTKSIQNKQSARAMPGKIRITLRAKGVTTQAGRPAYVSGMLCGLTVRRRSASEFLQQNIRSLIKVPVLINVERLRSTMRLMQFFSHLLQ